MGRRRRRGKRESVRRAQEGDKGTTRVDAHLWHQPALFKDANSDYTKAKKNL